jgi:hypothetical protein
MMVDINHIKAGLALSTHRAVTNLANGITKDLAQAVPNLPMALVGKKESGKLITAVVMGETELPVREASEMTKEIDLVMNTYKNPSKVASVLGG